MLWIELQVPPKKTYQKVETLTYHMGEAALQMEKIVDPFSMIWTSRETDLLHSA